MRPVSARQAYAVGTATTHACVGQQHTRCGSGVSRGLLGSVQRVCLGHRPATAWPRRSVRWAHPTTSHSICWSSPHQAAGPAQASLALRATLTSRGSLNISGWAASGEVGERKCGRHDSEQCVSECATWAAVRMTTSANAGPWRFVVAECRERYETISSSAPTPPRDARDTGDAACGPGVRQSAPRGPDAQRQDRSAWLDGRIKALSSQEEIRAVHGDPAGALGGRWWMALPCPAEGNADRSRCTSRSWPRRRRASRNAVHTVLVAAASLPPRVVVLRARA